MGTPSLSLLQPSSLRHFHWNGGEAAENGINDLLVRTGADNDARRAMFWIRVLKESLLENVVLNGEH